LFGASTKLLTHKESIRLFKSLGTKFIPELKEPSVQMPFNGMTQENYAQKLIDEYKSEGIPARDVFPQSFSLRDVLYWIKNEPEFGKQAIYLDGRYQDKLFDPSNESTWQPSMSELKVMGVNYIAPRYNWKNYSISLCDSSTKREIKNYDMVIRARWAIK
jgi:glycerophosphoryl diester phosphodiesterase